MTCIPLKKYLKENEDMAYDLDGNNSWKKIATDYLEEMFSGFSFEGTKLHEELITLIYHLFKSNPLKFNERENMYAYEFEYGIRIYRYYSNGLVVRYAGRSDLYNLIDDGSFIDRYSTVLNSYELPEKIKKEIKIKAEEAKIKAREELDKKVQIAAKKSVSSSRKRKPTVVASFLEDFTRYSLAFYQGAKWSNCKGYSKIPKVTKYPIYKIIDRLRIINNKLNHPIKIKINKNIKYSYDIWQYNTVEAIRSAIESAIENTLKINCGYQIGRLIIETPLSKIFNPWSLDYKPIAYFTSHYSEDDFIEHCVRKEGKHYTEADDINKTSIKEFSIYLRENSEKEENCYYLDKEFEYDPDKYMGATIKLVPNEDLSMLLIAYDKYVDYVRTLPFGEEWMIRNTIIPPSERK